MAAALTRTPAANPVGSLGAHGAHWAWLLVGLVTWLPVTLLALEECPQLMYVAGTRDYPYVEGMYLLLEPSHPHHPPTYRHACQPLYLYYHATTAAWWVGPQLGAISGYALSYASSSRPPRRGATWLYWSEADESWLADVDATLVCLDISCERFSMSSLHAHIPPFASGEFQLTEVIYYDRPVYINIASGIFLYHSRLTHACHAWLVGGRIGDELAHMYTHSAGRDPVRVVGNWTVTTEVVDVRLDVTITCLEYYKYYNTGSTTSPSQPTVYASPGPTTTSANPTWTDDSSTKSTPAHPDTSPSTRNATVSSGTTISSTANPIATKQPTVFGESTSDITTSESDETTSKYDTNTSTASSLSQSSKTSAIWASTTGSGISTSAMVRSNLMTTATVRASSTNRITMNTDSSPTTSTTTLSNSSVSTNSSSVSGNVSNIINTNNNMTSNSSNSNTINTSTTTATVISIDSTTTPQDTTHTTATTANIITSSPTSSASSGNDGIGSSGSTSGNIINSSISNITTPNPTTSSTAPTTTVQALAPLQPGFREITSQEDPVMTTKVKATVTTSTPPDGVEDPTPPPSTARCGEVVTERTATLFLISGRDSPYQGKWPWMAAVLREDNVTKCGAALVSDRYLVTAAHCIDGPPSVLATYRVLLGANNRDVPEVGRVYATIRRVILHSNFSVSKRPFRINNDVGVIELDEPVTFSDYIQPLCLPETNTVTLPLQGVKSNFTSCYIIGFGYSGVDGSGRIMTSGGILQEQSVRLESIASCTRRYFSFYSWLTASNNVCVRPKRNAKLCQGDSGSPLMCLQESRWTLVGVASWSIRACISGNFPSIYSDLTQHVDWLRQQITSQSAPSLP